MAPHAIRQASVPAGERGKPLPPLYHDGRADTTPCGVRDHQVDANLMSLPEYEPPVEIFSFTNMLDQFTSVVADVAKAGLKVAGETTKLGKAKADYMIEVVDALNTGGVQGSICTYSYVRHLLTTYVVCLTDDKLDAVAQNALDTVTEKAVSKLADKQKSYQDKIDKEMEAQGIGASSAAAGGDDQLKEEVQAVLDS